MRDHLAEVLATAIVISGALMLLLADRVTGIDAKPGSISPEIKCVKDEEWSYHVYLPKEFHTGRQWPVCFIMSPGGGSGPNHGPS